MFGRLPEGWAVTKLRDILKAAPDYGANSSAIEYDPAKTYRFVRITDIDDSGRLNENGKAGIAFADGQSYRLEENDIVIARTGATVGKSLIYKKEYGPCAFAGYLIRFKINEEACDPNFLSQFLLSPIFKKWVALSLRAGAQPNINAEEYQSLHLPLPARPEQGEIAALLFRWDRAVEQTGKLIAAKTRIKRGLVQQLLVGGKRFVRPHDSGWKEVRLGDVTSESKLRNDGSLTSESLMAVTRLEGMIPMRERVRGESVERCKVVRKDWFAYNPMRLNIGSIARWRGEEEALVSPDYVVFKCDESKLDPSVLDHLRGAHQWTEFVESAGDGSVRVRIWYSHLAHFKFRLPPVEEQRRIAAVLNVCDKEITLLKQQLDALKRQKRGLMRKLLTGQIRVKVEKVER